MRVMVRALRQRVRGNDVPARSRGRRARHRATSIRSTAPTRSSCRLRARKARLKCARSSQQLRRRIRSTGTGSDDSHVSPDREPSSGSVGPRRAARPIRPAPRGAPPHALPAADVRVREPAGARHAARRRGGRHLRRRLCRQPARGQPATRVRSACRRRCSSPPASSDSVTSTGGTSWHAAFCWGPARSMLK